MKACACAMPACAVASGCLACAAGVCCAPVSRSSEDAADDSLAVLGMLRLCQRGVAMAAKGGERGGSGGEAGGCGHGARSPAMLGDPHFLHHRALP